MLKWTFKFSAEPKRSSCSAAERRRREHDARARGPYANRFGYPPAGTVV